MPFFGVLAKRYEFVTPRPPNDKVIIVTDPDFEPTTDVVMKDVNDESEPMDEDVTCIPESFKCCITLQVMNDPWIDHEGHSYERKAILDWLHKNQGIGSKSPLTRKPLSKHQLKPNIKLREEIRAFKHAHPGLEWD